MGQGRGARPRAWAGRRPWARGSGLAAGLLLTGQRLVGVAGTPMEQLRVLREVGQVPADPVAAVIALLALLVEALIGYLLLMLVLWSLSRLPCAIGRVTGRVVLLVSPRMLHRLLDLLVGGTLLAQATLAPLSIPAGRRLAAVRQPSVPAAAACRSPIAAIRRSGRDERLEARPTPRRLAVPLPPWLEGGPSNPARSYTVEQGDTLWAIAAVHLAPEDRSSPRIQRYWRRIYRANQPVIGGDPNLLHPGTRLDVPAFRDEPP